MENVKKPPKTSNVSLHNVIVQPSSHAVMHILYDISLGIE